MSTRILALRVQRQLETARTMIHEAHADLRDSNELSDPASLEYKLARIESARSRLRAARGMFAEARSEQLLLLAQTEYADLIHEYADLGTKLDSKLAILARKTA